MKKWTVPLLVLLTVLLLISIAFLPGLAGALQDAGHEKEPSYWPVHSIVPYISEKGSDLRFVDKLTVMRECEISAIVPALASMTEQQVRTVVVEGMQPYVDAGIMKPYGDLNFHLTPYVAINWQNEQQYFLFWTVEISWFYSDGKSRVSIQVDDETGAFLSIDGYDPRTYTDWEVGDDQHSLSDSFARVWLEQTGLWDCARLVPSSYESEQYIGAYPDGTAVCEISDGLDTPLYIYFYVSSLGEYMMWF